MRIRRDGHCREARANDYFSPDGLTIKSDTQRKMLRKTDRRGQFVAHLCKSLRTGGGTRILNAWRGLNHMVSATVLEYGGDEDLAIAALLHDSAEDQGAEARLQDVRNRFGNRVADVVAGCSDGLADTARRQAYLAHLETAGEDILRVSLADKVHNARAILRDLRKPELGERIWCCFSQKRERTLGSAAPASCLTKGSSREERCPCGSRVFRSACCDWLIQTVGHGLWLVVRRKRRLDGWPAPQHLAFDRFGQDAAAGIDRDPVDPLRLQRMLDARYPLVFGILALPPCCRSAIIFVRPRSRTDSAMGAISRSMLPNFLISISYMPIRSIAYSPLNSLMSTTLVEPRRCFQNGSNARTSHRHLRILSLSRSKGADLD